MWVIIYLIFIHYVADFVMQKSSWATTKSYNVVSLAKHIAMYSGVMTIGVLLLGVVVNISLVQLICFASLNYISHAVIDFFTSRASSAAQYRSQENPSDKLPNLGMFAVIGFDQFLHTSILVVSYYLLLV